MTFNYRNRLEKVDKYMALVLGPSRESLGKTDFLIFKVGTVHGWICSMFILKKQISLIS